MKERTIFHLLQKFPKGAALHGHDTAMVSAEFVVKNITYRDNLYARFDTENETIVELKFFDVNEIEDGVWISVKDIRESKGEEYDEWMTKQITMHEEHADLSVNESWKRFVSLFIKITPMLTYEPVWRDYFYQMLKEFHEDNISYLEFRGTLPQLYLLDGTTFNETQICDLYVEVLSNFKKDYPTFFGAKFIYAPHRLVVNETFEFYMKTARELKERHPDFIAGFDLVGQEDLGEPLITFIEPLLELKNEMNLFLHAGETKWSGTSTDINLVDALLLETKRIGHGYAILKHPKVASEIKKHNIGIEVNPISNQVLGLVNDLRNHPAASMLLDNYPVVISSDDPGFWGAKGVTYDWYETFIGMASRKQDLHLLKQLALNSIHQTSLSKDDKDKLLKDWSERWEMYVNVAIEKFQVLNEFINEVDTLVS